MFVYYYLGFLATESGSPQSLYTLDKKCFYSIPYSFPIALSHKMNDITQTIRISSAFVYSAEKMSTHARNIITVQLIRQIRLGMITKTKDQIEDQNQSIPQAVNLFSKMTACCYSTIASRSNTHSNSSVTIGRQDKSFSTAVGQSTIPCKLVGLI